jgi:Sec-independent protein secretion pathway component TatC
MRKAGKPIAIDAELSMVDHLDELRDRLIICAITFVAALALAFAFNHQILDILNGPIPPGKEPTTFGVSEAFMTTMTISAYAALLISLPLILW